MSGCQSIPVADKKKPSGLSSITDRIGPAESVAVSWIYAAQTGNITELGNVWRDRVEKEIKDNGIDVRGRREIGFLIDDMDTFGSGQSDQSSQSEQDIWQQAEANILVCGKYRIIESLNAPPNILLSVKALRIKTTQLIGSAEWKAPLEADWARLDTRVLGNAFEKSVSTITAPEKDRPSLKARLDRTSSCYPSGTTGKILIDTDPGSYLYIFNIQADNAVTLLFPNKRCPQQPVQGGHFAYPTGDCGKLVELIFYPLSANETASESIKVVASRNQLDFSFLPVPLNHIYRGAQCGDIKQIYDVLKAADSWNEAQLHYRVGPACGR